METSGVDKEVDIIIMILKLITKIIILLVVKKNILFCCSYLEEKLTLQRK